MAVQSGWSPQFQSFTGLQEPNQFNIIEHLIHNRLNQQCYSNIDNQFSREFLIKIHEQVGLGPFWSLLCSGGNTQQCCTIDRLSISGGQPESILTKFLHAGVEYVFAKLYSPEASHAQNPHEILKSNECPYSNRQGNKVCINPVHFCRAFQTSTFNPRNQNTANLSDMILNRNESADVDLFQLNLMLEPTDSELPIGETISNDQSEFAFRNQLNSVSSSSGPVPQPILSPTSPHSTSFVANRPSTINYNDVSSPQSSSMDTSVAVPSVASVEQVVPEQIVDPTKQQENLLNMLKEKANEQDYWCSISYYEFNERVGEVWHAPKEMHSVFIDGFTQPSDGSSSGNRFSLGLLTNINRKPESDSARRYIGRGCTVYTDNNDSVFLYNMSESSIFVQSPICNLQHSWHPATVVKIPPQGCIEIFSNTKYEETLCSKINSGYEETFFYTYVCKIRISFVKGWGAQYRRQTVTACPCWVELRLNKPLGVLDAALKTILKNPSGEPPGSSLS